MLTADLYYDEIDFLKYLKLEECNLCGFSSCKEFVEAFRAKRVNINKCPTILNNNIYALEAVDKIKHLWPEVPITMNPMPAPTGLFELNNPHENSPIIISGNNEYTEEIILTVLSTTICPFHVIFVDTEGNTIDMSMIYKTFTPEKIKYAIDYSKIENLTNIKEMIIPGLAEPIKKDIEMITGWKVRVGPKCAAELPLYLSDLWIRP